MKDYIALVTVELHKFARQIAEVRPGRRQRSLRRVGPISIIYDNQKAGTKFRTKCSR